MAASTAKISGSKITNYFDNSFTSGNNDTYSEKQMLSTEAISSVLPTPESSPVKPETKNSTVSQITTNTLSSQSKVNIGKLAPDADHKKKSVTNIKVNDTNDDDDDVIIIEEKTDVPTLSCRSPIDREPIRAVSQDSASRRGRGGKKRRGRKTKTLEKNAVLTEMIKVQTSSRKTKATKTTKTEPVQQNKLVTDYFPVRRSDRKCKSEIKVEKEKYIEGAILNNREEGLKVVDIEEKGRGVIATKRFFRDDFVIEYAGDLISLKAAKDREKRYSEKPSEFGCYMYYFMHKNRSYCVDATVESNRLGRLINHSKKLANCHTRLTDINNTPHLILVASRDISIGEELLYDYGDRSSSSLEAHPWLAS